MSTAEQSLQEHLAAPVESKTFAVTDEQSAEWALRKTAQKRREMATNQATASEVIERTNAWLEDANASVQSDAEYLEGLLTQYHRQQLEADADRKTIKLPAGTLKARKLPDRIEVDSEAFVDWAQKNDRVELVRVTFAPHKAAIKDAALKDGEVLPGVEVVRGEIRFSVDTEVGE